MRILILILYTQSWEDIAEIVLPNLKEYCIRHSYTGEYKKYEKGFSGYEKLKKIRRMLHEYDAVWSLDMDTLITNHNIKVEDFLDEQHDAYFTKDYNGLNCGSFILKKTPFALTMLDVALATEGLPGMHCEQEAFNEVFKLSPPDIFDKIKFLPHPSINSYKYELYPEIEPQTESQGQWIEGKSFVLHLPGIGMEKRLEILKNTPIVK